MRRRSMLWDYVSAEEFVVGIYEAYVQFLRSGL